jgi:hypothetical protein
MVLTPVALAQGGTGGEGDPCAFLTSLRGWIRGLAGLMAVVGILLFGLSLILPQGVLSNVGLNMQNDYLIKLGVAALVIASASFIATTLFGSATC